MSDGSSDELFDQAMIASALGQVAERGWSGLNLADAAREAGLRLDEARVRFPSHVTLLLRLGTLADRAALSEASLDPAMPPKSPRELLFDMLMRRLDVLQQYRDGVVALLHALPSDPALALLLGGATARSMGWVLEGAGVGIGGLRGFTRVNLLIGAWLASLRAWERDASLDLSATMAALDRALDRIARLDRVFGHAPVAPVEDPDASLDRIATPPDVPLAGPVA